ncbi:MAG: DUF3568 family protein, partial [Planctomycetes bacterium]|nr:DUF3568 family protein [Planctomycetota bacterium]
NLDDAWAAAHAALNELGMPVEAQGRESAGAYIQSRTSDGEPVHITLDMEASRSPAEGTLTRVGVRVATFGDYDFSERILNQIGAHLVVKPPPGQAPAPATTLGPIQPVPAAPPRETAAPPLLPPEPLPAH